MRKERNKSEVGAVATANADASRVARRDPAGPALTGFFPGMRKAYLIGEAVSGFASELDGRVPNVVAGTLERAVALAARDAEAADLAEPVVLLSPACASFDQQFRGAW